MKNKAKPKLDQNSYKLFNSAVYSESLENIDNKNDIALSTHCQNLELRILSLNLISKVVPYLNTILLISKWIDYMCFVTDSYI